MAPGRPRASRGCRHPANSRGSLPPARPSRPQPAVDQIQGGPPRYEAAGTSTNPRTGGSSVEGGQLTCTISDASDPSDDNPTGPAAAVRSLPRRLAVHRQDALQTLDRTRLVQRREASVGTPFPIREGEDLPGDESSARRSQPATSATT